MQVATKSHADVVKFLEIKAVIAIIDKDDVTIVAPLNNVLGLSW